MTRQKLESNYFYLICSNPHPLKYLFISRGVSWPHPLETIFLRLDYVCAGSMLVYHPHKMAGMYVCVLVCATHVMAGKQMAMHQCYKQQFDAKDGRHTHDT
jgi:hypothetical protein